MLFMQRGADASLHHKINLEVHSQLATGFISLGSTAAAVMIFGQFLTHQVLDLTLFFGGFLVLIILYVFATLLLKRNGGN